MIKTEKLRQKNSQEDIINSINKNENEFDDLDEAYGIIRKLSFNFSGFLVENNIKNQEISLVAK